MTYQHLKPEFDRDGFVLIRPFLDAAQLGELTSNLDRYIRDVVPGLSDKHAFYVDRSRPETLKQMQHMGVDPFFEAYCRHPSWRALAQALLGEPVEIDVPEWFNKPPGTGHATPPHQDNYYFNLRPPNVVTIWLALDKVDDENGCLRYVAGSHKEGVRPHAASSMLGFSQAIEDYGERDRAREARIALEPGEAVAHHGNTIHRAEANRSPTRNRRAFAMVCRGQSCRRDEESYGRYLEALKRQHELQGLKT